MQVKDIQCFQIHPGWRKNWVFVKVTTDSGLVGWGECYSQYDRDNAVVAQVKELTRYLVGRDPFDIKHFCRVALDDYAQRRGSVEFFSALSGLECAMWDIVGKACDQPVYKLLGGKCREKVRVYANGWSYQMREPRDYAEAARKTVDMGFSALKFDPLPRPWRTHIPNSHFDEAERVVSAIREAVGPDVDLLIDLHRRLSPRNAITLGKRIAPYNLYWYEEPCQCEHVTAIREVRDRVDIPVVTGEAAYAKLGFQTILRERAADIINPDVANCGGILELREIAAMAEAELVAISPHNYNSTLLALNATVHASLGMPNFIITEYFIPFEELGRKISPNPLIPQDGYIHLPEGPGLGLEINEAMLAEYAYKPFPTRKIRTPADED